MHQLIPIELKRVLIAFAFRLIVEVVVFVSIFICDKSKNYIFKLHL